MIMINSCNCNNQIMRPIIDHSSYNVIRLFMLLAYFVWEKSLFILKKKLINLNL